MIELNTGKITFPELNITLSPLLHSTDFISDFPKDKILRVRDMKNGYIWYDISEKVYDTKIPVDLCFNPQGNLEFIELFPQNTDSNAILHLKNQTPTEIMKNKKRYCDEWLMKFCGLGNEENSFWWGSISSRFDPRSYSSGICIHYTKNEN